MTRISRYFKLPLRILMFIGLTAWWTVLLIRFPIIDFYLNSELNLFSLGFLVMSTAGTFLGLFSIILMCDVKTDGKFLYVENLIKKDKVPIENIKSYYIDFKGFNIIFKEKTKFGLKIFFMTNYFGKNKTKKYLNKLITVANSKYSKKPLYGYQDKELKI